MKHKLGAALIAVLLGFVFVPAIRAGELEDRLTEAVVNDDAAGVRYLLNKGADVNAKDESGETALMKASFYGYADIVRILLEKGAAVETKSAYSHTALENAQSKGYTEIVSLLQDALSRNPQALFALRLEEYRRNKSEETRERLIEAAIGLPQMPAIPDDVKQEFIQASGLLKVIAAEHNASPEDLNKPIAMLNEVLDAAPWWGDACYNLALALEAAGNYDDAIKQLNLYLRLNPPPADTAGARTKIGIIQNEQKMAARKQQEDESVRAVKYVSGGAKRLKYDDAPAFWKPKENGNKDPLNFSVTYDLFAYGIADEDPYYANAFVMGNGHIITITLIALSANGKYGGDKIGIWDRTSSACLQGGIYAFGERNSTTICGANYNVIVATPPNATVTVTDASANSSVTLSVALLYRCRALQSWFSGYAFQLGVDGRLWAVAFDPAMAKAAGDPSVNAMGLTPASVTPYQPNKQ